MRKILRVAIALALVLTMGGCWHTHAHIVGINTTYGIEIKAGFEQPAEGAVPTPVAEIKAGKIVSILGIAAKGAETKIDHNANINFTLINETGTNIGHGTADTTTVDIKKGDIPETE